MKLLTLCLLLLGSPAIAYTLVPDGNGGYNYGTGPDTVQINTIDDVNGGTQININRNGLPAMQCQAFRLPGGYTSTSCR